MKKNFEKLFYHILYNVTLLHRFKSEQDYENEIKDAQ